MTKRSSESHIQLLKIVVPNTNLWIFENMNNWLREVYPKHKNIFRFETNNLS